MGVGISGRLSRRRYISGVEKEAGGIRMISSSWGPAGRGERISPIPAARAGCPSRQKGTSAPRDLPNFISSSRERGS